MNRALVLLRRRAAQAVPTLLLVLVANFLLLRLAPGDVVDTLMIAEGGGDPAIAARLRTEYGLDAPLPVQLGVYLWKAVRLDLGHSFFYNQPVATLILERLPTTVMLMTTAIFFAFALGTALGALAALRPGSWRDTAILGIGMVLTAMPHFWLGLMLIVAFAVKLAWFPVGGIATPASGLEGLALALDIVRHLALPAATLSLIYLALYMRLMRAGMIEAFGQDFVRTARAKGLSRWQAATRHVARHALMPVVTMLGLQAANMLGGSVVVETVFSLPGIGRLAYDAVLQRDLNTLLGIVFVCALMVIAVNALVDLAYAWIDPRIGAR